MRRLGLLRANFRARLGTIVWGFLALAGCDLLQMLIPRLTGRAIDLLAEPVARIEDLVGYLGLILGLAGTVALLRFAWRRLIYGFSRELEKDLRRRLHSKFLRLSLTWHQKNSSGDLMALATNDIDSVRMAVGFGLVSLMDAVVMGLAAVAFMIAINPSLAFYAFLPMPLISVLTRYFGQAIYRKVLKSHDVFGQLTEVVRERLSGVKVIRAMGLESLAQAEVAKISQEHSRVNIRLSLTMGLFFPLMSLLTNLALALTLYLGGRATMSGAITPGDFVAFITYLALLSWPMMALGLTLGLTQQGLAALDRLGRALGTEEELSHALEPEPPVELAPPDPKSPALLVRKTPDSLEITLEKLQFAYPARPTPVLREVSLQCPRGSVCALTGPTGAGKSALAALLPALYEPTGGRILFNGQPSPTWPLARLRDLFGYAPQEGHIFTASLGRNLALGRPGATAAELTAAAEMAGLPLDPQVFPEGLDTLVGERGLTLSGGQRQRLALARAILRDPPFLILDDTLAAVDAAVEEEILGRLLPWLRGRGALLISHRLTTLKAAERILILENGSLTDQGSATELAGRPGYFQRISRLAGQRPGSAGMESERG
ncbi:MAG: ABC transporter ATP-binding protein/permease [Deltaproteobacteria bacterium]|jgi:ATP-binding cassette subfamily B protein|nr:ABC transporter ATP-binding protein/permease [Deltaproteobacteria bacterium]